MAKKQTVDWEVVERRLGTHRVAHESFEYALARARQLVRPTDPEDGPVGLALVGDARIGKTVILKALAKEFPKNRELDGLRAKVLYTKIPQKPTVVSVAEAILDALGDKRAHRGTKGNKIARSKKLLRDVGCMTLALDDFQHLVDKTTDSIQYEASDFLKEIMDDAPVNLLLAGLPTGLKVLRKNEQLLGRFSRPITLKRFNWSDEEHREQIMSILQQLREVLCELDLPPLDDEDMAFRFFCASGGLIGYIYKIIKQLVWNARDTNCPIVDMDALELAHLQAVDDCDRREISPFSEKFDVKALEEQIKKAGVIGQHVEPPQPASPKKRKSVAAQVTSEAA